MILRQADPLECVVSGSVFQRSLSAGLEFEAAMQQATKALEGWRTRDDSDQRAAGAFGNDWPISTTAR